MSAWHVTDCAITELVVLTVTVTELGAVVVVVALEVAFEVSFLLAHTRALAR
jgi:hypothetical protein